MATSGPNAGGTFADDASIGVNAWSNVNNVAAEDGVRATASVGIGFPTHYLKATNFGFAIPTTATINGITMRMVRHSTSGTGVDNSVKLVQGGSITGDNKATALGWPNGGGSDTYGGVADLWGLTWTPADINASNFGIAISAIGTGTDTAGLDFVSITITYTPGVSSVTTGTIVETTSTVTREADIVAGGKTIILTLTNDTWVASGATFDAQRQNIINGIDSAQAEAAGWDAEVKAKEVVGAVVRTSNTVVTITLSAEAAYNITATETITVTIPATALTGAVACVSSPTFRVVPFFNRITHLGGVGVGMRNQPRKMATARRAIVPMGYGRAKR